MLLYLGILRHTCSIQTPWIISYGYCYCYHYHFTAIINMTTGISKHPKLRTIGFCWSKFYCPHALGDGN